jgi:hypothetical protein
MRTNLVSEKIRIRNCKNIIKYNPYYTTLHRAIWEYTAQNTEF